MFIPTAIFIESGLEASPLALRARSLAPAASVSSFPDLTALASSLEALPIEEAKRRLVIARRAGGFVKEFPDGTGVRQSGWRYFIPAIGCPADCRYCFLQTWHAAGAPMLFADGPAMLAEIESTARSLGGGYFYGGELCDNLLLEPYLAQVGDLVSLFRRLPDATLELRTKSDDIAPLLAAGPAPNVVVSWTFTPQSVVEAYEPGTAPLDARIAAAARAQQAGFRVGLRFDPLSSTPAGLKPTPPSSPACRPRSTLRLSSPPTSAVSVSRPPSRPSPPPDSHGRRRLTRSSSSALTANFTTLAPCARRPTQPCGGCSRLGTTASRSASSWRRRRSRLIRAACCACKAFVLQG